MTRSGEPRAPGADQDVLVPRSVRWPLDLDLRVTRAAAVRELGRSQLLREWAEAGLERLEQERSERDRPDS